MKKWLILLLLSSPAHAQLVKQESLNSIRIDSVKQHNVASARAYVPVTTSDCMGSHGINGQAPFWGFGLSTTTQSKPCNIREDTKIAMWVLGDEDLAREIFMQGEYAKATRPKHTKGEVCIYPTEECKRIKRLSRNMQ